MYYMYIRIYIHRHITFVLSSRPGPTIDRKPCPDHNLGTRYSGTRGYTIRGNVVYNIYVGPFPLYISYMSK